MALSYRQVSSARLLVVFAALLPTLVDDGVFGVVSAQAGCCVLCLLGMLGCQLAWLLKVNVKTFLAPAAQHMTHRLGA